MAESFLDLVDDESTGNVDEDILAEKVAFDKIFLNCYNTPEGKRMLETLRERHVNIAIYVKGDTLEATAYRQGMSDLVTNIEKAVEDALTPPTNGR